MDKRRQRWGKWILDDGFITDVAAHAYADQMNAPTDTQAVVRVHDGRAVVYVRAVL